MQKANEAPGMLLLEIKRKQNNHFDHKGIKDNDRKRYIIFDRADIYNRDNHIN